MDWMTPESRAHRALLTARAARPTAKVGADIALLIRLNREIHNHCVNLDPAANVMNPRAEAALSRGLSSRPSLGHVGAKYETGLEAIQNIEEIAAALAREIFEAKHAEIRTPSGSIANLYAFMACARPGDAIITPPAAIGGHVTHQPPGAAGLYALTIHNAKPAADAYTVDLEALRDQARMIRPKLITIGGSLNFTPHPVREIRAIADEVGARVLFDAAHLSGLIAGKAWPNPLKEGAHLMTMSCYKSLGGPACGLVLTNEDDLAAKIDAIAFPGLTANSDAGKAAALALSLLDWRAPNGPDYASAMIRNAQALEAALRAEGLPMFGAGTRSHQISIEAAAWGGGQAMARRLRRANILACGIGLPIAPVEGDANGLRLGTPEMTRRGMSESDAPDLARLIARALREDPKSVADAVSSFRVRFQDLRFLVE